MAGVIQAGFFQRQIFLIYFNNNFMEASMEELLNKILRGVERNADEQAKTVKHLATLNSKVEKNSGWINRYDIRVAEDFPDVQSKVSKINVKLAAVGASVSIILTIVYFLIRQ